MLFRPSTQSPAGVRSNAVAHVDHAFGPGTPLPFPTEARLDSTGEPITLIQLTDWPGQSPAGVCVDGAGKILYATTNEITVTDPRVVPNPAIDQIRNMSRNIGQGAMPTR